MPLDTCTMQAFAMSTTSKKPCGCTVPMIWIGSSAHALSISNVMLSRPEGVGMALHRNIPARRLAVRQPT
jgi:hypothetical protein